MTKSSTIRRLTPYDWGWASIMVIGTLYALLNYQTLMDGYEIGILIATLLATLALGTYWGALRSFSLLVGLLSLLASALYNNDLAASETSFLLSYLLSSQAAIMWMCALFILATITYFGALILRSESIGHAASSMTWVAAAMGSIGFMVRWRESYLMGPDIGHIPVSNIYEVFIIFNIITALLYLYYEQRYQTRALGGFVLLLISAAVGFLLWYSFEGQGAAIKPLVPALQSWWMKIHVPANFVGYGAFSLAAMVAVAYLLQQRNPTGSFASRLPEPKILDDLMHKAIALGFAFFTIATVLGAMWAADAWGGYWSWDPKETWALIVWLNYAAWLHLRLSKGWHGKPMAWWAIIGLFITLFAFLGVNMFLSGLHSYGEL